MLNSNLLIEEILGFFNKVVTPTVGVTTQVKALLYKKILILICLSLIALFLVILGLSMTLSDLYFHSYGQPSIHYSASSWVGLLTLFLGLSFVLVINQISKKMSLLFPTSMENHEVLKKINLYIETYNVLKCRWEEQENARAHSTKEMV